MPRKKGWKKAESRVTYLERRKTGKYDIESGTEAGTKS